jgi:hypothetical protein
MSERPLGDIINVSMSRASKGVSRVGFGYAGFVATQPTTITRETTITKSAWATELAALGVISTDPLYIAIQDHFSQEPSPARAYLILNLATRQDITVLTYDAATTYGADVTTPAGTTSYTTSAAGSAAATAIALASAVTAHASVTAAAVGDDVQVSGTSTLFYVEGTVAGGTGTIDATPSVGTYEDFSTSLTAAKAVSDSWYAVITVGIGGRLLAQQTLVAAWAESNARAYGACSADANIPDTTDGADSTTIAAVIKANSYKNSFAFYHAAAATEYPEAALFGRVLPAKPGAINWNHKNLSGVTAGDFTSTQRTNIEAKRAVFYEDFGGSARTQCGTDGANGYGDYPDLTRLSHWVASAITTDMASLLVATDKIPFTNAGIRMCKAIPEGVMQEGVDNGAISNDAGYEPWCTAPDISDVSSSDKSARTLPDIKFGFYASGAINRVDAITGTLSV